MVRETSGEVGREKKSEDSLTHGPSLSLQILSESLLMVVDVLQKTVKER